MPHPSFRPSRHPRKAHRDAARFRRRRWPSFGIGLVLVALGGFVGTLAALRLNSAEPAIASVEYALSRGAAAPESGDDLHARFGFCHSGGGRNCVVDGDTFWFAGEKYRIADIDTPETHPPRCAEEARLGEAATERLREWLNEGAFRLERIDREADSYGRKLRVVTRGGVSVGTALVGEGLAREWAGYRRPWC
ncbi:thermonuclease family protein [Sphingopyxis sp. GW247-27LB]|uniref:thermonuclease family protein n=1 Tax=Sphingopyxis sp. GW247-27LB TaxID=2012632 RepID=UPI000BA6294B|nr:thermonuclease family protein [Sphingopyxis sp. GW247-27LB]PAL21250.1 nuclease [Sphingopyxis sp. GW247-27LB]